MEQISIPLLPFLSVKRAAIGKTQKKKNQFPIHVIDIVISLSQRADKIQNGALPRLHVMTVVKFQGVVQVH